MHSIVHYCAFVQLHSSLVASKPDRETAVSGKTAVTRQGIDVHKHFGWGKARRQTLPLPHGSFTYNDIHTTMIIFMSAICNTQVQLI